MAGGNRQRCRLFLEGREIPFISGSTVSVENQPTYASFAIVPLQVIKFIRPRSHVHLFVRDDLMFGDNNYYLAFEGEVVGRGFGKNATGTRFQQINAVDYSQYWDETKAYFYNANFVAEKVEEIAADPGTENLSQSIAAQGAATIQTSATINSIMIQKLLDPANADLIEGVTKVIKELNQVNLYYQTAYNRLRIADRVILRSSGKVKDFLQEFKFEEFLLKFTGAQGGSTSLREMLNSIMGLVFHQFVSVPFPSYLTGPTGQKTIANFLFFPDAYSLPPPKCNVLFPNQVVEFNFEEDFRASPTRMSFRYSLMNFAGAQGQPAVQTYPIKYYPPSFADYMYRTKTAAPGKNASLLDASSIFKDPSGKTYAGVSYGAKKTAAVGTALSPILREADFQTNDESIRGIFPSTETFAPAVSALAKTATEKAQASYFGAIGQYMFYKKRFAARKADAKLLFSPFIVPGFNCLFIDDSDAGQSVIAKLQVVTHSFSNEGCATNATLGYARDFDEVDMLSGGAGDPPPPAWFDTSIFGQQSQGSLPSEFSDETQYLKRNGFLSSNEETQRGNLLGITTYPKLNQVYQQLLGCDAVTDNGHAGSKLVTTRGATIYLSNRYRLKSANPDGRDVFVRSYVKRPVPTMATAMRFIGATPVGGIVPEEFAKFKAVTTGSAAGSFDGTGFPEQNVLKIRRGVIDQYILELKTQRGFRG